MPIDKNIAQRFKEGDVAAFDEIYRIYSKKMFHFALGMMKDPDNSKDLVQEVFVKLWEKREKVNPDLQFDNYIFTIAYNSVRKYFRKKSLETKFMNQLLSVSTGSIDSSEGTVIYQEMLALATKSIEGLPPQRKKVYKLSRQDGLKIEEIARELKISPRTAEKHLSVALKHLRKELVGITLLSLFFFHLFVK